MGNPLISIVIPTYNRSRYLSELLRSIVTQSYKEIELIIIDDVSSDNTPDIVNGFKIAYPIPIDYYRNSQNKGCGWNRLFGFDHSHGKYIIFADDDDYYTDIFFFEKAVQLLRDNNNLSFVSGNVSFFYESTKEIHPFIYNCEGLISNTHYFQKFHHTIDKPQSTFSTIFRKQSLVDGGLDCMKMVNDSSIYLRALLTGDAIILKDVIGNYRIHYSNITGRLSGQFIVDNLEEKRLAGEIAKEKGLIDCLDEWLYLQARFTIVRQYYSPIGLKDTIVIWKWCNKQKGTKCKGLTKLVVSCFFKCWKHRYFTAIARRLS